MPGAVHTAAAVLAVDGKRVRGAMDADGNAPHLLAVVTHDQALVLAQPDVHHKTNEIPRFAPLLDTIDSNGMLISADCLHTQRAHAAAVPESSPRTLGGPDLGNRGPLLPRPHR